jgi:hypothetical protein
MKKHYKPNSSNRHSSNHQFEGSNPQMKGSYYTYNPEQPAVDQYQETTDKLIDIVCSTFKEPQLLKACIKSLNKQTLTEPQLQFNGDDVGTEPTKQDELKFNIQFKEWQYRVTALDESLNKTFTIIHGQCNRAMKAKIEEDPNWEIIDSNCDPLGLLTIIKSIAHNNESQRNPTVSLIQAEKRLLNMTQGDGQTNDSYRLKFENQASVIENMGGQLYRNSTLDIASNEVYKKDYDKLTDDEKNKIKEAATELWKASLFIINSNQSKFDQLKKELHNNYISGDIKSYPSTFNNAYNRLNQHKTFGHSTPGDSQGSAFTQNKLSHKKDKSSHNGSDSDSDNGEIRQAPKRFENWTCAVCGEQGHPPSPNYCRMVRAIKTDQTVRSKLKASIENDSDPNDSDQSNSKSRKKKTAPKGRNDKETSKDKQSARKTKQKADLIKEVTSEVLTNIGQRNEQSSESSQSDDSAETNDDMYLQFQMCQFEDVDDDVSTSSKTSNQPDSDPTDQLLMNSRSAQNHRSAFDHTSDTWSLVSKKPKRRKHESKTAIHHGDTIIMKNNLSGIERIFTSDKRFKNNLNHFSPLNDNQDD